MMAARAITTIYGVAMAFAAMKPGQMRLDSGVQDLLEQNRLEQMNLALTS
jgi:flagellar motor component MotA